MTAAYARTHLPGAIRYDEPDCLRQIEKRLDQSIERMGREVGRFVLPESMRGVTYGEVVTEVTETSDHVRSIRGSDVGSSFDESSSSYSSEDSEEGRNDSVEVKSRWCCRDSRLQRRRKKRLLADERVIMWAHVF